MTTEQSTSEDFEGENDQDAYHEIRPEEQELAIEEAIKRDDVAMTQEDSVMYMEATLPPELYNNFVLLQRADRLPFEE